MVASNKHKIIGPYVFNISGLAEDVTPDTSTDYLAIFDASAGVNKKVLMTNLGHIAGTAFTIMQPDNGTAPVADSGSDTLSFTSADLSVNITGDSLTDSLDFSVDINALTVDGSPDGATDYVMTYDASAGGLKKVLLNNVGVTDHTALSNIGTNTHAQIDTDLTRLANTSGTNTGDQTTVSGSSGTTNALESATTTVNVSSATAPTTGQVLTATSSTSATWQAGGGGGASDIDGLSDGISDASSVFLGTNSGIADDGTANLNTGVGVDSLKAVTTGSGNTAVGNSALLSLLTGTNNTGIGWKALRVTTGSSNIGIGAEAMLSNAGGSNNIAIGKAAMTAKTTGNNNIAIGHQALSSAASGSSANTVAIGTNSGFLTSSGANNVYVGYQTGLSTTTGSNNIIVGYNIDIPSGATANYLNIGDTLTGDVSTGISAIAGAFGVGQYATGSLPTASSWEGYLAYDTTTNEVKFSDGATWGALGGGGGNSFETITAISGTDPVADSATDTLTLISTDSSISITGTASTDTLDFEVDINGQTAEATVNPAADYVMIYDASATANRKVLINNMPSGAPSTVVLDLASASAPSLSFTGDSNTGFYSPGADQFGFAAGGAAKMTASISRVSFNVPIFQANGSVGAPAYAFTGMQDGGLYRDSGSDSLRMALNGVLSQTWETDYISMAKILGVGQYATGSLPTASSYEGYIAYDTTTQTMKWSNGTSWATI